MIENLTWSQKSVFELRLPLGKYADLCIPPEEYLLDRFRLGEGGKEVFTSEAAMLLTKIHPIIVWSTKNYCVFGLRTLFIASSIIPTATISVGILPPNTPESKIADFILTDAWLTRLAFSTKMPEGNLFGSWKEMPKNLINALSPGLDLTVKDLAKVLSISVPTLYRNSGTKK